MSMVEIQKGISVDTEDIESVKMNDDGTSTVFTHHRKYQSFFPSNILLFIINNRNKQIDNPNEKVMDDFHAVLKKVGHFAG